MFNKNLSLEGLEPSTFSLSSGYSNHWVISYFLKLDIDELMELLVFEAVLLAQLEQLGREFEFDFGSIDMISLVRSVSLSIA